MERVFDIQMDKVKTKLIKTCSLVDEQFEILHELFKSFNKDEAAKVLYKNEEIKTLKKSIERNCQKIFVLTQPVANDLRNILLFLKMNVLFTNLTTTIKNLLDLIKIHSENKINGDITEIYEASYSTLELLKTSFDAFIVNDLDLISRIISSANTFNNMIQTNLSDLVILAEDKPENINAIFNVVAILNEFKHIKNSCLELCEDVVVLNENKDLE